MKNPRSRQTWNRKRFPKIPLASRKIQTFTRFPFCVFSVLTPYLRWETWNGAFTSIFISDSFWGTEWKAGLRFSHDLWGASVPLTHLTLFARVFFFFFFLFCHLTSTCEMFVAELTSVCQHIVAPGDILAPARHRPSYPPSSLSVCTCHCHSWLYIVTPRWLTPRALHPVSLTISLSSVISCSCVLISACLLVCLCV